MSAWRLSGGTHRQNSGNGILMDQYDGLADVRMLGVGRPAWQQRAGGALETPRPSCPCWDSNRRASGGGFLARHPSPFRRRPLTAWRVAHAAAGALPLPVPCIHVDCCR